MVRDVADYDFFSPGVVESPFEFYRALRQQAPVYKLPGTNIYMLSHWQDIRRAAKDTATFSNDFIHLLKGPEPSPEAARIYADGLPPVDTLLTMDPPRHKVYRSLINKVFSASRVEKMRGYMEQIVDELIDDFIDRGECEFVHDFATPLPVYVIADQLGVSRKDLRRIKAWSDAFASRLGGMASAEEILRLETPSAGLWRVVTRDTEIRGVPIPKDSLLMLRYAAGNRDESVFENPEQMDVCRANADDHIAFGYGTHFCPGAMLARKEMQVAFTRLLQRLTNIRLVEGRNDLSHWPNVVLRGLKELHITFDRKEAAQA